MADNLNREQTANQAGSPWVLGHVFVGVALGLFAISGAQVATASPDQFLPGIEAAMFGVLALAVAVLAYACVTLNMLVRAYRKSRRARNDRQPGEIS